MPDPPSPPRGSLSLGTPCTSKGRGPSWVGDGGRFGVGLLFPVSYTETERAGPKLSEFSPKSGTCLPKGALHLKSPKLVQQAQAQPPPRGGRIPLVSADGPVTSKGLSPSACPENGGGQLPNRSQGPAERIPD